MPALRLHNSDSASGRRYPGAIDVKLKTKLSRRGQQLCDSSRTSSVVDDTGEAEEEWEVEEICQDRRLAGGGLKIYCLRFCLGCVMTSSSAGLALAQFMRREPLYSIISKDHILHHSTSSRRIPSLRLLSLNWAYVVLLQLRHTWKMDTPCLSRPMVGGGEA